MSFLGNLIWLIFGGLLASLGYIVAGLGFCLTVVGIPIGWGYIKIGFATLVPFGREIQSKPQTDSMLYWVMNLIWLVLFGWGLLLNHLFWALILAITIVGLPFAKQHLKLIPIATFPFGRSLVKRAS